MKGLKVMTYNLINGNDFNANEQIETKYLIVGSGAGGAVASYLLNKHDHNTLVIEEGNISEHKDAPELSSNLSKWRNSGIIPIFAGSNIISYAEGSCVGGSTEINGALMWRTPDKILDEWRSKYELEDLSPKIMSKYFEEYENRMSIGYQDEEGSNNSSKKLLEIATNLKWSTERVKRAQKGCKNTNQCPVGCPSGGKQSMSRTYIQDYLKGNGKLIYNTKVYQILFEKNLAKKVLVRSTNGKKFYINFQHIFIASGVIQTPLLLLKSGIGKNVGNNFQIQPNLKIAVLFDKNIEPQKGTMMTRQINEFSKDGFSIGSSNFSPTYLSMTIASTGQKALEFLNNWKKTSLYISLMKFNGKGKIRYVPFTNIPLLNYKILSSDFEIMKKSILKMAEGFFSAGAKKIVTPFRKFQIISSINELKEKLMKEENLKNVELSAVHGMSTCGMSGNPNKFRSATGNYGQLHDFKNIYITDASILPTSLGVNPQQSISSLVMRNVDHFLNSKKII